VDALKAFEAEKTAEGECVFVAWNLADAAKGFDAAQMTDRRGVLVVWN
jgi:hypothetical protein